MVMGKESLLDETCSIGSYLIRSFGTECWARTCMLSPTAWCYSETRTAILQQLNSNLTATQPRGD